MVKKSNKPYRIPYQGSKQALVSKIYKAINDDIGNTDCLFANNKITKIYDLLCGGGSVGYYFSQQGYDVVMNDIKQPLIDLHRKLQEGIDEELLYKWIDREQFHELVKRQDWYGELIRCCWSFGNNGITYLFGKNIEDYKKQGHFIVVNKCQEAGKNFLETIGKQDDWDSFSKIYDIKEQKGRRLFFCNYAEKEYKYRISNASKEFLSLFDKYQQILAKKYTRDVAIDFVKWFRTIGVKRSNIDKITNSEMSSHYFSFSQPAIPTLENWNIIKEYLCLNNIEIPDHISILFQDNYKKIFQDNYKKIALQQLTSLQQLQHIERLQQLQHIERLQQLQHIESLEQTKNINFTCKNYWEFDFQPNSIIYCDPPYIGTTSYGDQVFDFDKFDNWVNEMKTKGIRVYISEYTNHNNAWREVVSFNKLSLMNNSQAVRTIKQEKVFCNI